MQGFQREVEDESEDGGEVYEDLVEEVEQMPQHQEQQDPLRRVNIARMIGSRVYLGRVENIDIGKVTGEILYHVKYDDGDEEHLTAEQVGQLARKTVVVTCTRTVSAKGIRALACTCTAQCATPPSNPPLPRSQRSGE